MKKLWTMLLSVLSGALCLTAAANEAVNLDFSQKNADGKLLHWKQRGGIADITAENGVLKFTPKNPAGAKFIMQSPLLLKAGGNYTVTYEARTNGNMKGSVYIEYRNAEKRLVGVNAGLYPLVKDWKKVSYKFSIPEKFSGAYMVIMISAGDGVCEFRNLSLQCTGTTDFASLKRESAAITCFPLPQQVGSWRKLGAASGKAEFADNVLKISPKVEKGIAFMLKQLNLKPAVSYEVAVQIMQKTGKYGVYIEYTAPDGRRRSVNGSFKPAPGKAVVEKFKFTLPEGSKNIVLVLAVGDSTEFAEFSNLELKEGAMPTDPTSTAAWRGAQKITYNGKPALLIADSTATAKANLRKGQYYRFSFDGVTRSSRDVTGFAKLKFTAASAGQFFFRSDWDDIIGGNGSGKEFVFCSPVSGLTDFAISTKGTVAIWRLRIEEVNPQEASPADVVLTIPAYRKTVYTNQRHDIAGFITLKKPAAYVDISLLDAQGKVIGSLKKVADGNFKLANTANLPIGIYSLQVKVFDKSHKALPGITLPVKFAAVPEVCYQYNAKDNTFYRNGKPIHYHGFMHYYYEELAYLYQRKGFTTFLTIAGTPEQLLETLDKAHKNNFRLILSLRVEAFYRDNKEFVAEWERYIRYMLTPEVLAHPALAGYCSADEPAWCSFPLDQLAQVTQIVHQIDPSRPVWINEAPRGSIEVNRRIARLSDAFGVDIYPIPYPNGHSGLDDKTITSVGAYTRRCREAAGSQHPIWMVLQGFAWNDLNSKPNAVYPTRAETRFMALDTMANGGNAIIYWGVYNIRKKEFYLDMLDAVSEVGLLSKLWQAGNTLKINAAPGMTVFAGTVDGERYIVALNTTNKPLDSQIDLTGLYELPSMKKAQSTIFPAYTARVFASVPRYPGDFTERIAYDAEKEAAAMAFLEQKFAPKLPYRGKACWIWYPGDAKKAVCASTLYKEFDLKGKVKSARLRVAADDTGMVKLNGKTLGKAGGWRLLNTFEVSKLLKARGNRLEVLVRSNGAPPSGMIAELEIVYTDNRREVIVSDASWLAVKPGTAPRKVEVIAPYGGGAWGNKLEYTK